MAYSVYETEGDGVTDEFPISFTLGFNSRDEVKCRVDDEVDGLGDPVYRTLTWINDGLVTVGGDIVGNNVPIRFTRTVDKEELQHDYANGEPLDDINLDQSYKQLLFAIHELLDGRPALTLTDNLDMYNFKIVNLRDPASAQDAATKAYVDATATAAQNEPVFLWDNNATISTYWMGKVARYADGIAGVKTATLPTGLGFNTAAIQIFNNSTKNAIIATASGVTVNNLSGPRTLTLPPNGYVWLKQRGGGSEHYLSFISGTTNVWT